MNLILRKIIAREFLVLTGLLVIVIVTYLSLVSYNYYNVMVTKSMMKEIRSKKSAIKITTKEVDRKLDKQQWFLDKNNENCSKFEFWKTLYKADIYKKSYEDFLVQFSRLSSQKKLHKYLIEEQYLSISFDEFQDQVFPIDELFRENFESRDNLWVELSRLQKSDSISWKFYNNWSIRTIQILKQLGFTSPEEFENFIIDNSLNVSDESILKKKRSIRKEINELQNSQEKIKKRELSQPEIKQLTIDVSFIGLFILFIVRYLIYAVMWSVRTLEKT